MEFFDHWWGFPKRRKEARMRFCSAESKMQLGNCGAMFFKNVAKCAPPKSLDLTNLSHFTASVKNTAQNTLRCKKNHKKKRLTLDFLVKKKWALAGVMVSAEARRGMKRGEWYYLGLDLVLGHVTPSMNSGLSKNLGGHLGNQKLRHACRKFDSSYNTRTR